MSILSNLTKTTSKFKNRKTGIKLKIALSFSTLTTSISIAGLIILLLSNYYILNGYFSNEMQNRLSTLEQLTNNDIEQTAVKLNRMCTTFAVIWQSMEVNDVETLSMQLGSSTAAMEIQGYVATNLDGDIMATNITGFSANEQSEFMSFLNDVKKREKIKGYAEILNKGICIFASQMIKGSNGDNLGTITFVCKSLIDEQFVDRLKMLSRMDITLFNGDKRINTTITDKDGKRLVGTSLDNDDILETVYKNKRVWTGINKIYNIDHYSTYSPIESYDGKIIGMTFAGLNVGMRKHLNYTICSIMLIAFIIIGTLITIVFTRKFVREISKPVIEISNHAEEISNGNLKANMPSIDSNIIEVDWLSTSMIKMHKALHEIIEPVLNFSQLMTAASEQLSKSSLMLSDGANRQAASLEEISSSMEEMSANIQNNTSNSMETNNMAIQIGSALTNIDTASSNSLNAAQNIAEDIVSINELVMQTNILSLNASVEAARAGEQGKGFAVVAKEVGRLAEQTKNTATVITETASKSIHESETTSELLTDILPKIKSTVSLIKEITAASVEQNAGAEQINAAITELNKVTQENAASAEEIAANSEELASTAEKMHSIVQFFNV